MRPRLVVVVHRERMVAEGIAAALARCPGILPLAATSVEEAARCCERADAIALDQRLPSVGGIADDLRKKGIRVVMLGEALAGDDEGARVSTQSPVSTLVAALVPGYGNGHAKVGARARSLTPRERDVLTLVARGLAGKQVARHLGISPKTVEVHKTRIFAKLGVPNQAAAVYALGNRMEGSELWTSPNI
jgi:DNA-binding CsgD family transcriptional regulator